MAGLEREGILQGRPPNLSREMCPQFLIGACAHGDSCWRKHVTVADIKAGSDKKEKAKKVLPALSAVLDEKAFADSALKQKLTGASGKGDKNIQKSAQDLDAVRAELARRVVAAGGE